MKPFPKFLGAALMILTLHPAAQAQWSQVPTDALSIYEVPDSLYDVASVSLTTEPLKLLNGDFLIMYFVGGPGDRYFNYVQRLTVQGEKLWGPDGVPVVEGADSTQGVGKMTSDGAGGAILVWWDHRNTSGPNAFELYGQRISATGDWLWDPAGVWLATPHTDMMGGFSICEDGEGGAYIAWAEDGPNLNGDIWAQRIDGNGSTVWPQLIPICQLHGQQDLPKVVLREGGGCFIVWHDLRTFYERLGAQRLSPEGRPLWGPQGLYFSDIGSYYDHQALSDRRGGFLYRNSGQVVRFGERGQIVWDRQISSTGWAWTHDFDFSPEGRIYVPYYRQVEPHFDHDVYGRCFDVQGRDLWGGERPLAVGPGDQGGSPLALTRNGFMVAFGNNTYQPNNWDIFFQIVDSSGHAALGSSGRPLYATPLGEGGDAFIPDGQDGAIAFFRNSQYKYLRANRILPDGSLGYPQIAPVIDGASWPKLQTFGEGMIRYELSQPGQVSLELYDLLGRLMETMEQGYRPAGSYNVSLSKSSLPSGVYFTRLATPAGSSTSKIIWLK